MESVQTLVTKSSTTEDRSKYEELSLKFIDIGFLGLSDDREVY